MDSSNEQLELEEGEIDELEDGEIEDDETTEKTVKTTSNVTPSSSVDSDFSRNSSTVNHEDKISHYSPKIPPNIRRRGIPSPRYSVTENRSKRPQYERALPAHVPEFMSPRTAFLRHIRGSLPAGMMREKQRPALLPTPPRLPVPLMNKRSKPYFEHSRPRSPSPAETPDIDNMDDFDLLLKRHKQIQLQLETLEKEESEALLDNEDIIDDSFIDIPVDGNLDHSGSEPGSSGVLSNEGSEEKSLPEKFSPFKIKPLRPPIPSIKELSEKQKHQDSSKDVTETLENISINADASKTTRTQTISQSSQETRVPGTASARKKKARQRRRKRQIQRKKEKQVYEAMLARTKDNRPKLRNDNSKTMEPTTEIDSKLMMIASSSAINDDMDMKMRNTTEQQKIRREKLKQWQKSHWQAGKVHRSPSVKSSSDGKEFDKDDYLEAPMDVESDTPDGPVLPLIEEAGKDPPPPPPLPLSIRDQELMTLFQQQQQTAYGNYPLQSVVNSSNVSPNIHGFYPPGQIIFNDWQSAYPVESAEVGFLQTTSTTKKPPEVSIKSPENEEDDDDDEADLLREILLKSVAKKRAAKTTDKKTSYSSPVSPQSQQISKATRPAAKRKDMGSSVRDSKPKQIHQQPIVTLTPPQHAPVVIQLGNDTDDSDDSDKEEPVLQQRAGFFGSLDMMIKQARQSAVENSKPKQPSVEPTKVPKTPDALSHLPEERRAEYKRLKEQLALHEGKKRQPLSDISQDKETKSGNEVNDEKMEVQSGESSELTELKEKVKLHEEKLTRTRNLLNEDQQRLTKMTSLLSDKTTLLEEQEAKVAKLKKQLEVQQKAMLNNKDVIKRLHEKATIVKDRVSKRITSSRNIEEELLRMKSMVSAMRRNPGFQKNSENKEISKASSAEETRPSDIKRLASLKRSVDDLETLNSKKAKVDSPRSQSVKASPRKQALADMIAQEKARLKALEQELAKKLSNFSKTSVSKEPYKDSPVKSSSDTKPLNNNENSSKSKEEPVEVKKDSVVDSTVGESMQKSLRTLDMIDAKQLDHIKTLQAEKEKKGPVFPSLTVEIPLPVHKKVAKCIWLDSMSAVSPVVNVKASNIDWIAGNSNHIKDKDKDIATNSSIPIGLYESVLLYFKSYRLSPYYRTKSGLSLKSLSHTNKINPVVPLCKYELKGTCNDEQCQYQHKRDYTPTTDDTMKDLAAYIVSDKENTSINKGTEEKLQDIIQNFVKQYKNKISMDDLYLLLVNHVRVNAEMIQPFYICGVNHSMLLWQNRKTVIIEESTSTVDTGRGVHLAKKEEQKGPCKNTSREHQEVRYFSEVYNSLTTLSNAVQETPSDVALWIKLARLQLCQKSEDEEGDISEEQTDTGVLQSLNTLSRGLEANPDSEELWLEYLTLFHAQENSTEHKELCEQAIGFTPSFNIWWHYLESTNTYNDKRTICIRLINHLASQDDSTDLHSHRLLESLLYLVQLELYTGRVKAALSTFMLAIGKKHPTTSANERGISMKLTGKLSPTDLTLIWLGYIHVFEFHRLPGIWFDQRNGHPSRMVAKDAIVFPWQPGGGTRASSEKLLALFHEALKCCTHKDKSLSKVSLCLPLYQNLLALERAHGRVDSAKGICRRLLQGNPTILELWQCLGALEESTGSPTQALGVLKDGLTKCSNDCELAYTMARLYLEQKKPSMAIELLITNTKIKYLKPTGSDSKVDPIKLYRKLLNQPLPYDSQPVDLVDKPSEREELYLWLSYCLLLELAPTISPLCLQYNLSADSAYETAVHSILNTRHAQSVWLEYLFFKKSKLLQGEVGQQELRSLDDLIGRCLVSVTSSRSLPFSTSESWQDYTFHNQVINLYLGCLPQSLWSAVFSKYLKSYPGNVQLTIRACEHEVKAGSVDQAVKIAALFLAENPKCLTMWKIIISLNLQRNHTKEALKLYQQSTNMLPLAATLWKDFIMFEMVHGKQSSVSEIIQSCDKIDLDIQEYLNTLLGK